MRLRPVVKAMIQVAAVAMSLAIASGPFAQQVRRTAAAPAPSAVPGETPVVALLAMVDGDVLASTVSGLVAVKQGASLQQASRVMTMAKANATIQYVDGCIVEMKPNMRVEIRLGIPCASRLNLAQRVVPDPVTQVAVGGSPPVPNSMSGLALSGELGEVAGAAVGVAGVVAIIRDRSGSSVSPN